MRHFIAILICGFLVAPPLASPALGSTSEPKPEKADKMVCKRLPPSVGTRLAGQRVCRLASDWKREQDAVRVETNKMRNTARRDRN